jgi:GDP-L-fucose synthase
MQDHNFLMDHYSEEGPINIGTGTDLSIRELAVMLKEITGYTGKLTFDETKPDGTPRKLVDTTEINGRGWCATTALADGLEKTYDWHQRVASDKTLRAIATQGPASHLDAPPQ